MKKIIPFAVSLLLVPSICAAHWADSQIEVLQKNEILQEVFEVENIEQILSRAITREEFFTLVATADDIIKSYPNSEFVDFNQVDSKFVEYIGGVINSGVVAGVPENGKMYIKPKVAITRQEAAVILGKVLKLSSDENSFNFSDTDLIKPWAKPYLSGVVKAGVINGYPDNSVKPLNNITVAEAIAMVANAYNMGYFSDEVVSLYAGTGEAMLKDGLNTVANFAVPTDIALKNGKLYIADSGNNAVRVINDNQVITYAGSVLGRNEYNQAIGSFRDGKEALFDEPTHIVALENGLLITDKGNNLIRFIDNNGYTTTFAGSLKSGLKNGKADVAQFNSPTGIAIDSIGNVYVADTANNVIRKIDINKNVTTFAGSNEAGYKDGKLESAQFNSPMGLEIVGDVIYVADTGNQRIRMIKDGVVSTYAGNGIEKDDYGAEILGDFIDGDKNTAQFNFPVNVVADSTGVLYVADKGNSAIRKIDLNGNVTTITQNLIKRPSGLVIYDGKLFVTDSLLNRIFKIEL